MDLENLKSIWKEVADKEVGATKLEISEIKDLLKGKAQDAFSKIKRSLFFEVGSLIVASLVMLVFIVYHHSPAQVPVIVLIIGLLIGSGVYYFQKYMHLKRIVIQQDNLKDSLKTLVSTLEKFLKVYFIGNLAVMPISTLLGFLYGFSVGSDMSLEAILFGWKPWSMALLVVLITTAVMYVFLKWYIKQLYGNYLQRLKICLVELEEDIE